MWIATLWWASVPGTVCCAAFQCPQLPTPRAHAAAMDGASAQQPANPSTSGTANPTSPQNTNTGNQNPLAVNPVTGQASAQARNYRPLTDEQRWKLYWKQNYWSVGAYFGPLFTAAVLDQTTNTPGEWGGGLAGYSRRFGSRLGTGIVQGTVQAALAAPLHVDVRYITSRQKGFKRRTLHAIAFSFVTYNAQGQTKLNIPNIVGYYAAAGISNAWVPVRGSAATYTLGYGSEQLVLSVPVNIIQEFWPEIRHTILRSP